MPSSAQPCPEISTESLRRESFPFFLQVLGTHTLIAQTLRRAGTETEWHWFILPVTLHPAHAFTDVAVAE